jgi:hypothetical protein
MQRASTIATRTAKCVRDTSLLCVGDLRKQSRSPRRLSIERVDTSSASSTSPHAELVPARDEVVRRYISSSRDAHESRSNKSGSVPTRPLPVKGRVHLAGGELQYVGPAAGAEFANHECVHCARGTHLGCEIHQRAPTHRATYTQ